MNEPAYLFSDDELSTFLERERLSVLAEVEDFDSKEWMDPLPPRPGHINSARRRIRSPQIGPEWVIFTQEVNLTETVTEFFVPYTGDSNLFRYCPSQHSSEVPRAEVSGSQLVFTIARKDFDGNAVQAEFEHERANVEQWLVWMQTDVDGFNASLNSKVETVIEAQRQPLLHAEKVAEEIR
jgi:hypothetical protein